MRTNPISLPIASVRRIVGVSLQGTAVVHRYTWASDGIGGGTATFAAVGTVGCLIASDGKPRELLVAGVVKALIPWTVDMPHDADCDEKDRIVSDGHTYEVLGTNPGKSQNPYLRATCVRLQ